MRKEILSHYYKAHIHMIHIIIHIINFIAQFKSELIGF